MTKNIHNTTNDDFLGGKIQIIQPQKKSFRAGVDSIILAATIPKSARGKVADLGAGSGVVGIAIAYRSKNVRVTLAEKQKELFEIAKLNVKQNKKIENRINVINVDVEKSARVREQKGLMTQAYSWVVANPPFNSPSQQKSPHPKRKMAKSMEDGTLTKWTKTAASLLKAKGKFAIIMKPESIAEIMSALQKSFGDIKIMPIQTNDKKNASRVIIHATKGSKTKTQITKPWLIHQNKTYTRNTEKILRGNGDIKI